MTPETLAKLFHDTYEEYAPHYNYQTRPESSVPFEHLPENNRDLMIAVSETVLGEIQHRLSGELVGILEAELNLDPCPAIKLAGEIAGKVIRTK